MSYILSPEWDAVRARFQDDIGQSCAGDWCIDTNQIYSSASLFAGAHDNFGYVLSIVMSGTNCNDSVMSLAKVWGDANHGENARRVQIVLCERYRGADALVEAIGICVADYPNVSIVIEYVGVWKGLIQALKAKRVACTAINWDGCCCIGDNRNTYANKRSQANVCLSRAITEGRFKITTPNNKDQIKKQIMQRPFTFDDKARFKMDSIETMRKKGIPPPDIADTFAFLFLEGVTYTVANAEESA